MVETNIREYKEVGRLVSEYRKHPKALLEMARGEMKKWNLQNTVDFADVSSQKHL